MTDILTLMARAQLVSFYETEVVSVGRIELRAMRAALRALNDAGYRVVPVKPTHDMERAYFTAPMPVFKVKATRKMRHIKNHEKMCSRWRAMIQAAPAIDGGE